METDRIDYISLKLDMHQRSGFAGIAGRSPAMQETLRLIGKVTATDSTVLVTGERGSGKELVARVIHEKSSRADFPFVVAHCGTIPYDLVESELFGHMRGAFTSAYERKQGLFQIADGGTIFLDEICELSPFHQVKLLRVLEAGMMRPVGSVEDVKVDVRAIAASHRDLAGMVKDGSFREDLFFRVNVFPIHVPPLRERREDLPVIVSELLAGSSADGGRTAAITPEALELLMQYEWPGNVRELENVIERATILCGSDPVTPASLPQAVAAGNAAAGPTSMFDQPFRDARAEFERQYIRRSLRTTGGNVTQAAALSGMSRAHFYELLKKHSVTREG